MEQQNKGYGKGNDLDHKGERREPENVQPGQVTLLPQPPIPSQACSSSNSPMFCRQNVQHAIHPQIPHLPPPHKHKRPHLLEILMSVPAEIQQFDPLQHLLVREDLVPE